MATCGSDEVHYTGIAFGSLNSSSGGNSQPICMASGDPGAAYNGANHGSYLIPLGTYYYGNDAIHQLSGLTASRTIPCAVCATSRVCYEPAGTATCAPGWSAAHTGELAGGYFSNTGNVDAFCYQLNNSAPTSPNSSINQVFAASTGDPLYMSGGVLGHRHTKCARCCK